MSQQKEGKHKTHLKKMLYRMGESFPKDASRRELERIFNNSPKKYLFGWGERKSKRGTDIYDRRRRVPGNMFRG